MTNMKDGENLVTTKIFRNQRPPNNQNIQHPSYYPPNNKIIPTPPPPQIPEYQSIRNFRPPVENRTIQQPVEPQNIPQMDSTVNIYQNNEMEYMYSEAEDDEEGVNEYSEEGEEEWNIG